MTKPAKARAQPRGKAASAQPRPRGRPVKNQMPEPIPDTPENVARAIMQRPPKKDWDYLKKDKAG